MDEPHTVAVRVLSPKSGLFPANEFNYLK